MADIEPITREEILLNSIAEGEASGLEPITRQERYLSAIAGETELPENMHPETREEIFLQKVLDNGTGGGGITPTGSQTFTENGTYDVTSIAEAVVDVGSEDGEKVLEALQRTLAGDVVIDADLKNLGTVFNRCSDLTSLTLTNATGISSDKTGDYFLNYLDNLVSFEAPKLVTLGERSISYCPKLEKINLPSVTSISANSIQSNTSLKSVVLPKLSTIYTALFLGSASLLSVDILGGVGSSSGFIRNTVFSNCPKLDTLIIRTLDGVCTLSNPNIFDGAQFSSSRTGGTIYVPQTLVSSYESDTNWAAVLAKNPNNQILSIENSIYETQYADGTPISE